MKKSLVYLIVVSSVFATAWSMVINNNIDELKKELKTILSEQENLQSEIQLADAEIAFLINPKNLKILNNSHFNLIPKPLVDIKNFILENEKLKKLSELKNNSQKEMN